MQTKFAGNLTLKMQAFSGNPCLTHVGSTPLYFIKKTAKCSFRRWCWWWESNPHEVAFEGF